MRDQAAVLGQPQLTQPLLNVAETQVRHRGKDNTPKGQQAKDEELTEDSGWWTEDEQCLATVLGRPSTVLLCYLSDSCFHILRHAMRDGHDRQHWVDAGRGGEGRGVGEE